MRDSWDHNRWKACFRRWKEVVDDRRESVWTATFPQLFIYKFHFDTREIKAWRQNDTSSLFYLCWWVVLGSLRYQVVFLLGCGGTPQKIFCATNWPTVSGQFSIFLSATLQMVFILGIDADCSERHYMASKNDYSYSTRYFYRTHWNLSNVPSDIPAEARQVYLERNYITSIPAGVFSQLGQCTCLRIAANHISIIDKEAFRGLYSLRTLNLNENNISVIYPGTFSQLKSLDTLSVGSNFISVVKAGMFNGLGFLQSLHLYHKIIETIEEEAFDSLYSLKTLGIYLNRLITLDANLFFNMARPLQLLLSVTSSQETNNFICRSMCWLKHEMHHGTSAFPSGTSSVNCGDVSWDSLLCGDPGNVPNMLLPRSYVYPQSPCNSLCLNPTSSERGDTACGDLPRVPVKHEALWGSREFLFFE